MEAFVPYEVDLSVTATQKEKIDFMMFFTRLFLKRVTGEFVSQMPEEFKKFFKISNPEGSVKEVSK